jgi:hypothetical protein
MTDAPEKIWFTKVGKNIIPNSQRMSPEDVEYLRKDKHIAYLADYRAAYEGSCEQIDELRAEVARLRADKLREAYLEGFEDGVTQSSTRAVWPHLAETADEAWEHSDTSNAINALAYGKTWQ